MNLMLHSAISTFGTRARMKLSNPAATGEPEDQLRAPFEQLIGDLAEICGLQRSALTAVGESSLASLKTLSSEGKYYQEGRFHRYKTPDAEQFCQQMTGFADAEVRKAAEKMRLYLSNELGVPTQRDEPTEKEQLLRGASGEPSSESGAELLSGSEASSSSVSMPFNRHIVALEQMRTLLARPDREFYVGLLQTPIRQRPVAVLKAGNRLPGAERIAFVRTYSVANAVLRR